VYPSFQAVGKILPQSMEKNISPFLVRACTSGATGVPYNSSCDMVFLLLRPRKHIQAKSSESWREATSLFPVLYGGSDSLKSRKLTSDRRLNYWRLSGH